MANYTKTTDFAAKDTLPGGDTNKVVRGSEFETEFDAISTAIATKSDTAGPTFTGTVTIPTVDINAGAIDGTTIGASSAAAGTFTNLTASGTVNFNGATISNLGTITTANLDGGTADNVVIGGSTAAAGTFTTLAATSATVGGAAVLTSVAFSNIDAGAITTSSETFADSDTQIPTNAAVKDHVEAVIPTLTVTEASVTAHQAALAITASQLSDVTSTATELNLVDGSTADTVVNSKAVIYGAAGQITANELDVDNIQIDANAVKSTNTNGNIQLFPNGTGFTELYGNTNAGAIRFNCESNSHGVTLKGPPHSAGATYSLELPNADGSAGQLLKTDGSGKLSFTTVNPSPSFTATASGSIANGDPVIINSDGTVSSVAQGAASVGTAVEVGTYRVGSYHAVTFDPDNSKVIYAYDKTDSGNRGHAIVGTISGSSISFGTDVQFEGGDTDWIAACYDTANDKVVIAFSDAGASSVGKAIVGTVSGTSISFGSAVTFNSANTNNIQLTYDSTNGKVVIAYRDAGNNNYGTAIVGTVSGTSISFGSETVFASINSSSYHSLAFDSNAGKVVITYRDNASGNYEGKAIVGTVSGTSISFGSAVTFESDRADEITCSFDSGNNKIVCVYMDYNAGGVSNTRKPTAVVGTVSGTSISFGSSVLVEDVKCEKPTSAFDSGSGKVIVMYGDSDNSELVHITSGSVSGTSMSFVTPIEISGTDIYISHVPTIAGDPASTKSACIFRDDSNSDRGTAVIYDAGSSNITTENYVGIADAAYSDSATATIQTIGAVDDAQSSLTPGQLYYVQGSGGIATTPDTVSVVAGVAVASTKLLISRS